jgi:hypothetical protein
MACSATLPAIQRQITDQNSNIRLRTTQAKKTNDRQFPSPCGFLATGGNGKKHRGTHGHSPVVVPVAEVDVVAAVWASVWPVGPS